MRKLILFLSLFTFIFTSCKSDDEGGQDSFVGSWRYFKSFEDDIEFALEDCEDQTIFDISSNGTFMIINYSNFGSGCELDFPTSGEWEKLNLGSYALIVGNESNTVAVQFTGNTMIVEDTIEGVNYKDIFIRQ